MTSKVKLAASDDKILVVQTDCDDQISRVISEKREVFQLIWVKEGWGWLYTRPNEVYRDPENEEDEDDLFFEEDKSFVNAINKHVKELCDCFGVSLAENPISQIYHYETADSFTFEGEKEYLERLRLYLFNSPKQCPHIKKAVDEKINPIWEEYNNSNSTYNRAAQGAITSLNEFFNSKEEVGYENS